MEVLRSFSLMPGLTRVSSISWKREPAFSWAERREVARWVSWLAASGVGSDISMDGEREALKNLVVFGGQYDGYSNVIYIFDMD